MCVHACVCFMKTLPFHSSANAYRSVEPSLGVHSQTQPVPWLPFKTQGQKWTLWRECTAAVLKCKLSSTEQQSGRP